MKVIAVQRTEYNLRPVTDDEKRKFKTASNLALEQDELVYAFVSNENEAIDMVKDLHSEYEGECEVSIWHGEAVDAP